MQMEGNQKRSAWLIVAFLGIVLLIYYFNDLVGLLLNRYYSPYWSCKSVWEITKMYAETPCVSKVRFEQVDGGKGGIDAVCYMRWDAGIEEDLQAYSDLCSIVSSDKFLSAYFEDVFSEEEHPDTDRIIFSVSVVHQDRSQLSGDAFYQLVESEEGFRLVQTSPFPPKPPIRLGYESEKMDEFVCTQ